MPLEDKPNSGTGPSSSDQDQSSDPAQAQPEEGTQEMEIQTSDSDPLESSGEGEILRKRQRQQSPAPGSSTSTGGSSPICANVGKLTAFVVPLMSKLCAPVRDEEIAKLATLTEPVEIFREIFRVLELMKLDMANFTIQSLRPHLQQKSIEYERNKFQEFLKTQQDGLQYTSEWLEQARENLADKVKKQEALQQQQQQASSSSEGACSNGPVPSSVISPAAILNHAYVDLLNADPREAMTFPEVKMKWNFGSTHFKWFLCVLYTTRSVILFE
eukprot:XP_011662546.1 PREDICTED: T-complex protein 11-like protein 1 [Strongylocentrotus purpuratus]